MNNASLELGGDNWAAKDGNLLGYAVGDSSGKYVPNEFTFTRGSNLSATRVNADGYIEKGYENTLLGSNDWAQSDSQYEITGGEVGYDGTNDAWLVNKLAAAYFGKGGVSISSVATISIYAKAGSLDKLLVFFAGESARFDLTNVTAVKSGGGTIGQSIELVSGTTDWYRCSLVINVTSSGNLLIKPLNSSNQDVTGTMYIQDAMINQGLAALPYVESGASAAKAGILENEPRIDYSSGTASLLLEPSRTNLVPYSEYIDGLGLTDLTTTPNATTSPEGVQNAYKMLTGTAGNEQISHQVTGTSGNNKTHSVYIKADSGVQWIRLIQIRSGFSNSASIWFDIQNGVKGSKTGDGATSVVDDATKIEDAGNGWYRLTLVCTDSTNNTNFDTRVRTAIADGSLTRVSNGSYFVWGYQMESDASYPTSYIPNHSGGTITRGADVANDVSIPNTPSLWSCLVDVDFSKTPLVSNKTFFNTKTTSGAMSWRFFNRNGVHAVAPYFETSASYAFGNNEDNNRTDGRVLLRYNGSGSYTYFRSYLGVVTQTTATGLTETNLNQINFNGNDTKWASSQILVFPTALSDADCISLTTL